MKGNKKRPDFVEKQMNEIKEEAHESVLARGLVQFRLNRNSMQRLLETADAKGLGYGVLARMWLCERLEQEQPKPVELNSPIQVKDIRRIVRQEIEQVLSGSASKHGSLKSAKT